ncbi:histidine N-acetyltransferase-like [Pecten maximus]|uniref:histidine N-acetyltransferase-like n=1 Tax=Pecten maximus TaxID=6579 RepID=UPI00145858C1|nr:histidine N-acetyltransferase-like [Pecten maximus]
MDVVECRKVGIEDYDDVMSIRDVYDGLDYLPALYRTFMADHTGYAVIVNKTIVAFQCASFIDDGETIILRALRMRKEYEGRGLVYRLRAFVMQDLAEKPRLKRKVSTTGNVAILQKVLQERRGELIVQRDILFYQGEVSKVVPFLPTVDNVSMRILNKDDLQKLLVSKADTDRLFPQGRIIVDWVPYRLLASNVDHFFNKFCHILGSESKDGNAGTFEYITLAVSYIVPNGIRYNVEIYGNFTEETFSLHMSEHLRNCSTLEYENINFLVHYESGSHDASMITKTMQQFGMSESNTFHSRTMYGIEVPMVPLSKY